MKKSIAPKLVSYVFVIYLICAVLLFMFLPTKNISESERRKLAKKPELSVSKIYDKSFFDELETYLNDHFPFRDSLRSIKAVWSYNIINQIENNNIYVLDGYASKLEYPINENGVNKFIDKINFVNEKYCKGNRVFYSVIPDKNYFMAYKKGYPSIDYDNLFKTLKFGIDKDVKYLDITPTLSLQDYYKTDTHWKQSSILNTANIVLDELDNVKQHDIFTKADTFNTNVEKKKIDEFYGVYSGQSALKLEPDIIEYYTSDAINKAKVWTLDTNENSSVYRLDKLDAKKHENNDKNMNKISLDRYDIFMGGAASIQKVTNELNTSGKKLIIFRDSFGSSLTPLLISEYSEIILVDLRYVSSSMLAEYVDFDNADVLFLYSTLVINNGGILK